LVRDTGIGRVHAWSRRPVALTDDQVTFHAVDITDEASIAEAAGKLPDIHLAIIATGLLHRGDEIEPEKTFRDLDGASMAEVFLVNTIGPALVAKHVLPKLPRDGRAVFAAISARIGSIADNRIGGWYSYRASKAALNQIIRTLSIELARTRPSALCVGLHPGTVDTRLSEPFQSSVPNDRMFAPARAAAQLLTVLSDLDADSSGQVFAWDGTRIPF
ncbi:MAG: SDR family NAD(P)-dependent oxidoreductase, partial [Alphaproteobacteria bacterium]|nr:SDR family NAD(P)-dependent oxidoreductase [Alphaproteobacteria bacterium]